MKFCANPTMYSHLDRAITTLLFSSLLATSISSSPMFGEFQVYRRNPPIQITIESLWSLFFSPDSSSFLTLPPFFFFFLSVFVRPRSTHARGCLFFTSSRSSFTSSFTSSSSSSSASSRSRHPRRLRRRCHSFVVDVQTPRAVDPSCGRTRRKVAVVRGTTRRRKSILLSKRQVCHWRCVNERQPTNDTASSVARPRRATPPSTRSDYYYDSPFSNQPVDAMSLRRDQSTINARPSTTMFPS